ncbi:MAG: hypothetical protein M3454_12115 [Actinomycetota bacterium]|nr:hypothetical protein [Actinomycetota bacterium]
MTRRAVMLSLSIACFWGLSSVPAVAGGGGGCHEAPRPFDDRTQLVAMEDSCFSPAVVRTEPKKSITWVNRDLDDHSVTGVGGTWGSYNGLGRDARVTASFAATGVYPYFCNIHPGMVGAVVVGDGVSVTETPPKEGHAVSSGAVANSGDRDRPPSSSASEWGVTPWLWAAPVVLAAGVIIGRRRKLA